MIKRSLLFAILISSVCYSQNILILNAETKTPIENLIIFNTSGKFVGKTNRLGEIDKEALSKHPKFILIHPSIDTDTLSYSELKNDEILVKQVRKNTITEIASEHSTKEYLVLTGYFTMYSIKDGYFMRFIDGMIQYVFDRKTEKYVKHAITDYRYFKFDRQFYLKQENHLIHFNGVGIIPTLQSLALIKKPDSSLRKNYNQINDQLVAEFSAKKTLETDKKMLGYLFNHAALEEIFIFSGEDSNPSNLLEYCSMLSLQAKRKEEEHFSTYMTLSSFYPKTLSYANKNELEKGLKIKSNMSRYKTNFWENSYYPSLYHQISPKPSFRSYQEKNKK